MTKTELRIFRLKDEIRILKVHLRNEQNPDKYSLKKSDERRQADIKRLESRIEMKESVLEQLQSNES